MKYKINPFFQKIKHSLFNHTYFFYLKILIQLTTIKPKINLLLFLVSSHYSASLLRTLTLGFSIQTLQQFQRLNNSIQFTGPVQGLVVLWQCWLLLNFNSFAVINKNIRHFNNKAAISYFKKSTSLRNLRCQHPFLLHSLAIIPHKVGLESRLRGPLLTAIGCGSVLRQYAAVRNYVSKAALLEVVDTSTRVSVAPASEVGTGDNQLKNTSNGINQIMTEITNNPMYIHISQIFNSSVDGRQKVNNRKKKTRTYRKNI